MRESVRDLVWRANLPPGELAARCGVSPATLRRYIATDRAPAPVRALLEIYAGRVPWSGGERLVCVRGVLYAGDCADGVPLREIPAYRWRLGELEALRREVRQYRDAPAQYLLDV